MIRIKSKFIIIRNNSKMIVNKSFKNNYKFKNNKVMRSKTLLNIGDICLLKITALTTNNVGIDEYSYPYLILVPNAKLGSTIKAKIVKKNNNNNTTQKYAIATLIEESVQNPISTPVNPGDVISVKSNYIGGAAIAELENNYKVIIPGVSNNNNNNNIKVKITRVKKDYAFAKLENFKIKNNILKNAFLPLNSKLTVTLPTNIKLFKNKYYILNVSNKIKNANNTSSFILFKLDLGAKLGDKVRIKLIKTSNNFAIGKIIKVISNNNVQNLPISKNLKEKKLSNILYNIRQMVKNGMHFGEKAIKCHARMKNYVWSPNIKINKYINKNLNIQTSSELRSSTNKNSNFKNLFKINSGRDIINLFKTRRCLNKALNQLGKYALKGRTFLFIGTKKPAAGLIARASYFSKNSFFVNTRWLGGMLTNWKTIKESIRKIRPILKEKSSIIRDILTKRQNIKLRLIKKALLLRKKSQVILTKGRALINKLTNPENQNLLKQEILKEKINILLKTQTKLALLNKLFKKQRKLILLTNLLKEKAVLINTNFVNYINQLTIYTKKLREYKSLYYIIKEIQKLKEKAIQQNKSLYSVKYNKLNEVNISNNFLVPNPPKEILKIIIMLIKNINNNNLNISKITQKANLENSSNIIILSKLITTFLSFKIKSYIYNNVNFIHSKIQMITEKCSLIISNQQKIKKNLIIYLNFLASFKQEFQTFKNLSYKQRAVIKVIITKLKVLLAQKKLLQFLPRLRYLPTPQTQISNFLQILLTKIVDPKLKYPIDSIYDQKLKNNSKKDAAARKKKWQRLEKYFGGIAGMTKLNNNNNNTVAIIIGQKEEMNAVRECKKMGLKTFTVVDTNCNPLLSDHIIPANDDSRNSIKYILNQFITRIRLAQKLRQRAYNYKKL